MKTTPFFRWSCLFAAAVLGTSVLPAGALPSGIFDRASAGCGGNGCHTTTSPVTRVCITGIPSDGSYAPGETYDLTVFVDGFGLPPGGITGSAIAGFNFETTGGTLSVLDGTVQRNQDGDQTTHTLAGNARNHWTFEWTAPGSGFVTLFLAGNAVNGNGDNDTGDLWNRTQTGLVDGAGGGAGDGIACNPAIPLPQLVPIPLH